MAEPRRGAAARFVVEPVAECGRFKQPRNAWRARDAGIKKPVGERSQTETIVRAGGDNDGVESGEQSRRGRCVSRQTKLHPLAAASGNEIVDIAGKAARLGVDFLKQRRL